MGLLAKIFGSKKKESAITKRNFMNIQIGDIIIYYGIDYEVYAVVEWMQEGYSWKEYKLKNREDSYWVSAEIDDGEVVAGFYTIIKDFQLEGPVPKELEYQGIKYILEEKGNAVGLITSREGKQQYNSVYYDFECNDPEKFFSIEDFEGEREISTGIRLKMSEIDILPGG